MYASLSDACWGRNLHVCYDCLVHSTVPRGGSPSVHVKSIARRESQLEAVEFIEVSSILC